MRIYPPGNGVESVRGGVLSHVVAFLRVSIVFFGFALLAPASVGALPALPFTLDDSDNRWRPVGSERVRDGVRLESPGMGLDLTHR